MLTLLFAFTHYLFLPAIAIPCFLVARRILDKLSFDSWWEEVALCTVLGLGLLSHFIFLLGILGLLYAPVLIGALLLAVALTHRTARDMWLRLRSGPSPGRVLNARVIMCAICFALMAFQLGHLPLYPPTECDATSYHLALSKIYVNAHAIVLTPYLRYPVFAQTTDMFLVAGLLLYDEIAAQLTQFLLLGLSVAGLIAWGRRLQDGRTGIWAAALLLSSPLIGFIGTTAYIDMGVAVFVQSGVHALSNGLQTRDRRWLVVSGVLLGFAVGTKYSALFFPPVLFLAVLVFAWRDRNWKPLLWFGLAVVVVGCPWYVRNYVLSGNPCFPFFARFFESRLWDAVDLREQMDEMRKLGPGRTWTGFFMLPYHLSYGKGYLLEAPLSTRYLWCLPLMLPFVWFDRRARWLCALVIAYTGFWFMSVQSARYLAPVAGVASLVTALSVSRLVAWMPGLKRFARHDFLNAVVAFVLLMPGLKYAKAVHEARGPIPVAEEQRFNYIAARLPAYPLIHDLNLKYGSAYRLYTSPGSESVKFYADGVHMGDYFGPAAYLKVLEAGDEQARLKQILKFNPDHVLVRAGWLKAVFTGPQTGSRFEHVGTSNDFELYRIRAPDEKPKAAE